MICVPNPFVFRLCRLLMIQKLNFLGFKNEGEIKTELFVSWSDLLFVLSCMRSKRRHCISHKPERCEMSPRRQLIFVFYVNLNVAFMMSTRTPLKMLQ